MNGTACQHAHGDANPETESDDDVVAFLEAALPDAKELQAAFHEAAIEVQLGKRDACGTSCGCSSKVLLMTRRSDLPRVTALLDQRWRALVDAEGTTEATGAVREDACPACGTAAAENASACADCGLVWG